MNWRHIVILSVLVCILVLPLFALDTNPYPNMVSPGIWICDGSSDEVEINEAIRYIGNGGTLLLAPGEFSVGDTINTQANSISIIGSGTNTTVLVFSSNYRKNKLDGFINEEDTLQR